MIISDSLDLGRLDDLGKARKGIFKRVVTGISKPFRKVVKVVKKVAGKGKGKGGEEVVEVTEPEATPDTTTVTSPPGPPAAEEDEGEDEAPATGAPGKPGAKPSTAAPVSTDEPPVAGRNRWIVPLAVGGGVILLGAGAYYFFVRGKKNQ